MSSQTRLEREIQKAEPVYGNTVQFTIPFLVRKKIATVIEIETWVVAHPECAWMEGASEPVLKNVYRGHLRQLVRHNGRLFSQLFVDRDLMEARTFGKP